MDRFLTHLGLALRAGRLAVGEEPVYEALARRRAHAVFLAADAAQNTRDKLKRRLDGAPLYPIPATKAELGHALGRATCAFAAVTDPGFAKSLIQLASGQSNPQDGGVTI